MKIKLDPIDARFIHPTYTHFTDKNPSLSWGFMVYAVRWHMHRLTQADFARAIGGGVKQEHVSRWELGRSPVPQTVRTWLVTVILNRLDDGIELPVPSNLRGPGRTERQQTLMNQHGTFGGKGKTRSNQAA